MDAEKLVQMANRIGTFFEPMADHAEAVRGVAAHLRRFWAPSMRRELLECIDAGGAALLPIVREAIAAHRALLEPPPDRAAG
jgi:formate dehydrogenase subunit delta